MLKKTIQYEDFDGNQVVKDFYFNLTKAELVEQQLVDGHDDLRGLIAALIKAKENKKILGHFKTLLASTVGERVGDRFIKNDEIRSAFMDTNAYGEVVFEFFKDSNTLTEFFKGVVPKDMADKVPNELPKTLDEVNLVSFGPVTEGGTGEILSVTPVDRNEHVLSVDAELLKPAPAKKLPDYTLAELEALPFDEFHAVVMGHKGNTPKPVLALAMKRAATQQ